MVHVHRVFGWQPVTGHARCGYLDGNTFVVSIKNTPRLIQLILFYFGM